MHVLYVCRPIPIPMQGPAFPRAASIRTHARLLPQPAATPISQSRLHARARPGPFTEHAPKGGRATLQNPAQPPAKRAVDAARHDARFRTARTRDGGLELCRRPATQGPEAIPGQEHSARDDPDPGYTRRGRGRWEGHGQRMGRRATPPASHPTARTQKPGAS